MIAPYFKANRVLVYRVHWLRAKAMRDRWSEEVELLSAEFQWTIEFFHQRAADWEHRRTVSMNTHRIGHSCYAARQQSVYSRLRDQCQGEQERSLKLANGPHT